MQPADDRGLWVCGTILHRQITAMPCLFYEVRLIHSGSRQPYPGVRRWTASRLLDPAILRFLRIRNGEGYEVYFRPYVGSHNAGYILLDLDQPTPGILRSLQAHGHEPSAVVETSPGKLQAWIRVSREPLPLALATGISRKLAQLYAADRASADGRHLGRLAGFANRKPQRRQPDGPAPWVKLIHARNCVARDGVTLIKNALTEPAVCVAAWDHRSVPRHTSGSVSDIAPDATALHTSYHACLTRLQIRERYPSPDWSIADKWIARELLQTGTPTATVAAVLRHGSPGFPRRHADPDDYLRRTIHCAAREIQSPVFLVRTRSLD